jgi:hypothetical protein
MVWQPAPPPQQPQQEEEDSDKTFFFKESSTLKRSRGIARISVYGFWFLCGVAIANLSRFIPHGWILYWVAVAAITGYLLFAPSEESEEALAVRRLTGMALALSCIAFWDALLTILTLPFHIFMWIMPVGLVGLLGIGAFILILFVVVSLVP